MPTAQGLRGHRMAQGLDLLTHPAKAVARSIKKETP